MAEGYRERQKSKARAGAAGNIAGQESAAEVAKRTKAEQAADAASGKPEFRQGEGNENESGADYRARKATWQAGQGAAAPTPSPTPTTKDAAKALRSRRNP